ncbi:MAG: hypothetical protein AAF530_24200 [Pseudomonadota bacterium]
MRGLLLSALLLLAALSRAQAQPACDERHRVVDQLERAYGESLIATGITGAGSLVEVYAARAGETWSILITRPGRLTCLVSAGEGWRASPLPLREERLEEEAL